MSLITFTVRSGSSGELYELGAERTAKGVRFTCTCQAGQNGLHCKHRVDLLLKKPEACVELDAATLSALHSMVEGSPLIEAVEAAEQANEAVEEAKREQKRAKKFWARAMVG